MGNRFRRELKIDRTFLLLLVLIYCSGQNEFSTLEVYTCSTLHEGQMWI